VLIGMIDTSTIQSEVKFKNNTDYKCLSAVLLNCVLKVIISNLVRDTSHIKKFSWFSSVL